MHPTVFTQAWTMKRVAITIPASGGTAATLAALAVSGGGLTQSEANDLLIGGRVLGAATAYNAGDSTASQPHAVAINQEYSEPCVRFCHDTYVKSTTGSTISAVLVAYLRAP